MLSFSSQYAASAIYGILSAYKFGALSTKLRCSTSKIPNHNEKSTMGWPGSSGRELAATPNRRLGDIWIGREEAPASDGEKLQGLQRWEGVRTK